MRTNVTFQHPAKFIADSEDGEILSVRGADWFAAILRRVPGLELDDEMCQEDWGVVFFARRNQKKFWIGVSAWQTDDTWLAHFHHGSFAWLPWFRPAGKRELRSLLTDVHKVLASEPSISAIAWHDENDMKKPKPVDYPTPVEL